MTITRRDFLNGMALGIAAGLTPLQHIAAATRAALGTYIPGDDYYPPGLTGKCLSSPGPHGPDLSLMHQAGMPPGRHTPLSLAFFAMFTLNILCWLNQFQSGNQAHRTCQAATLALATGS